MSQRGSQEKKVHDSKTLQPAIEQQQRLTGITLKNNFVDRGYRGVKEVLGTKIIIPDSPGQQKKRMMNKWKQGYPLLFLFRFFQTIYYFIKTKYFPPFGSLKLQLVFKG